LLLCANNHVRPSIFLAAALQSFVQHTHESRRQESVYHGTRITARDWPKIGAGPGEDIGLGHRNPGSLAVWPATIMIAGAATIMIAGGAARQGQA